MIIAGNWTFNHVCSSFRVVSCVLFVAICQWLFSAHYGKDTNLYDSPAWLLFTNHQQLHWGGGSASCSGSTICPQVTIGSIFGCHQKSSVFYCFCKCSPKIFFWVQAVMEIMLCAMLVIFSAEGMGQLVSAPEVQPQRRKHLG